jgi:hypothetical protein
MAPVARRWSTASRVPCGVWAAGSIAPPADLVAGYGQDDPVDAVVRTLAMPNCLPNSAFCRCGSLNCADPHAC